jgi:hypothetical protein
MIFYLLAFIFGVIVTYIYNLFLKKTEKIKVFTYQYDLDNLRRNGIDIDNFLDQLENELDEWEERRRNNVHEIQNHEHVQNHEDVHDTVIQSSFTVSYQKLNEWKTDNPSLIISDKDAIKQIKEELFKINDIEKIDAIYSTLKTMIKFNEYIISVNCSEIDVLTLVWSRINDPVNKSVKTELVENLFEQLYDSNIDHETDHSRCLTGRVTRIIQSLESLDKEDIVNIVSTSSIKREISDKIPLLIKQMYESWTPEQINQYEDNDDRLTNDMKHYIYDQFKKEYVDRNIITKTSFNKIIEPYINEL